LACFDRVIELKSDFVTGHYNRGSLLMRAGRFGEALKSLDDAIAIDPLHVNALINRASVLIRLCKFDDAIASCERAIAPNLESLGAIVKRGLAFGAKQAVGDFDPTPAMDSGHALAWNYRGAALGWLGRFSEALASSDRALAINPKLAEIWQSRGLILFQLDRTAEAEMAYRRALALQPDHPEVLTGIGNCLALNGDVAAALACFDQALAIVPDLEMALSTRIYTLDFSDDCDFSAHQAARAQWWHRIGERISAERPRRHETNRDPARRIVLGYVSADFRIHSAAFTFLPVLANHDKEKFEVICYSGHPTEDAVTASFRNAADRWRDTSQWTDDRLEDCIRADKVDILIDLSGHSRGNRLRVFAGKPAPIQVTAWGHATGTGQPTIDYLFSDPVLVPAEVRHLFAEQVYDLPCASIIAPPPAEFRSSEPPVTANGYLTYGVFNRITKVSDAAIDVWARILRSDATARLMIKHTALDDASTRTVLQDKFASRGISQDRLQLMGTTSREDHLAAYRHVDICLDPFPQGGGVSTWEALHMGVPVVTKLGNAIPKRLGAAILSSIGMADWVASDDDQYVAIALRSNRDQLGALRRELPDRISARCGPTAYTWAVEAGYQTMWKKYCDAIDGDADKSAPHPQADAVRATLSA
jgi:predicted O-linked N-acetylglucosamine transferase (SPINDLY family)